MHHEDELKALRRDLDELLSRAAGMQRRIAAVEREIRLKSLAQTRVEADAPTPPVEAAEPVAPPAVPPPLPPQPVSPPVREAVYVAPAAKKAEPASPEFVGAPPSPGATSAPAKKGMAETAMPGAGLEERIWKYWMPRVAGVLAAIGVAWFLYYIGPSTPAWLRVAFGYFCSITLLATGLMLEKKYLQYARVLYGTAIGISYFVSFAAHYISAARIIESETTGIGLLVAVVVGWGIVAQVRKSRIVATLVTMLGHLTMGLAFFTTGELAKYSIAGVAILGLGSAFFLLYNRWYYVAVVGLVGCYLNHALWTLHFFGPMTMPSFGLSFGFLCAYMLTFALAELFCAEDLRRSTIPTKFRTMFVTANTVLFFGLTMYTLLQHHMYDRRYEFYLVYSGLLALLGLGYLRVRAGDPLYNAYLTKAVSAFTLYLAARYGQGTLTASLAVESVVLLYSSRRSGLVVTRLLAFGAAMLCVAQGIYTVMHAGHIAYSDPMYWRRTIKSAFAVLGMFAASQLYQRTDWSVRAAKSLPFSQGAIDMLWDLDIAAEPGTKGRRKPYGGLQVPYVYAIGGGVLFFAFTVMLNNQERGTAAFACFVLAMTLAAIALRARPFGLVAMLGLVPAVGATVLGAMTDAAPPVWLAWLTVGAVAAAAAAADRRIVGAREGLAFHQMPGSAYVLYCAAALMLAVLTLVHADSNARAALYLAVAAAISTGLVIVLHRRALATAAVILLAFGTLSWSLGETDATAFWHVVAVSILAVSVFSDRFFARERDGVALRPWGQVTLVLGWFVAALYVKLLARDSFWFTYNAEQGATVVGFGYYNLDWVPFAWACVAFAYVAYAAVTRSAVGAILAIITSAYASMTIVGASYGGDGLTTLPLVFNYVSLALFWAMCERFVVRSKGLDAAKVVEPLSGVFVGATALLLVLLVERVPSVSNYFLAIGWGLLAMLLFGVSLLTWQRFYRFAGLGVFLLGIARLFYDARNLEGVYRPLAFIGLSVLMFIVSFGYYRAFRNVDVRKEQGGEPKAD